MQNHSGYSPCLRLPSLIMGILVSAQWAFCDRVCAADAQANAAETVAAGAGMRALAVTADEGTELINTSTGRYDFGVIYEAQVSNVRHLFVLKNNSASPMTLDRLMPSCGCTTAVVNGAGSI